MQVGQATAYLGFIKLRISIIGTYTAHSTTVQVGQATAYFGFIKLRVSIIGTYTARYPAPSTIFTACRGILTDGEPRDVEAALAKPASRRYGGEETDCCDVSLTVLTMGTLVAVNCGLSRDPVKPDRTSAAKRTGQGQTMGGVRGEQLHYRLW